MIVAPDAFKGTFSAGAVARAIAGEISGAVALPVADGGEGTLAVLAPRDRCDRRTAMVHDPVGREIEAEYGLEGELAVVEAARAAGLGLLGTPDPWAASTRGVGELIVAARNAGAREIVVGLGGTATTDGGAGAVAAIGRAGGLGGARLRLLCDVTTPFELAAPVFGPQKGADPAMVLRLAGRLDRLAGGLPRDPRGVPMTGAAGGLAGGLWAAFGALLVGGADYVLDAVGFDRRLAGARAVITGEGRLDDQTAAGKAASAVIGRARAAGVPVHAVVGVNALAEPDWRALGLSSVREARTLAELAAAGRALAELV